MSWNLDLSGSKFAGQANLFDHTSEKADENKQERNNTKKVTTINKFADHFWSWNWQNISGIVVKIYMPDVVSSDLFVFAFVFVFVKKIYIHTFIHCDKDRPPSINMFSRFMATNLLELSSQVLCSRPALTPLPTNKLYNFNSELNVVPTLLPILCLIIRALKTQVLLSSFMVNGYQISKLHTLYGLWHILDVWSFYDPPNAMLNKKRAFSSLFYSLSVG